MNLKEVEIACFERMISGLKNFDLVFVFKDYDRPVQRITAIPIEHSE
jgi:nucleosome binding factor SPN SPT16 subunit